MTTATDQGRVCLLLADLSGYTAYLANSEPDHAPALAGDLVETVVRQLSPTLRLAKLQVRWHGPATTAALAAAQRSNLDRLSLTLEVEYADR